jgi:hypothetical protein
MKATLEFDLREESDSFHDALHGSDYSDVISDLYTYLRNQWKYEAGQVNGDAAHTVWEYVSELLSEKGLHIP